MLSDEFYESRIRSSRRDELGTLPSRRIAHSQRLPTSVHVSRHVTLNSARYVQPIEHHSMIGVSTNRALAEPYHN